ncbi:MAG: calcium/sodium antiporter [Candidatus Thermoplasmatota archaeon]|nr:calcium/sodium antiporter [Candidatus Thermoplasmatota archaeon]
MLLALLGTLVGLALLIIGANFLVDGAAALAKKIGISGHVIGLTLVAAATSLPELFTSTVATFSGEYDIAVGNIVGSNAVNISLILGIGILIQPIRTNRSAKRDSIFILGVTVLLFFLAIQGIEFWEALIFLGLYIGYTILIFRSKDMAKIDVEVKERKPWILILLIILGIAFLSIGSPLLVRSAASLAVEVGVSAAVIGSTLIAVGTSFPELLTSIMASVKGHEGIAFGNVFGSNIFNILMILGVSGIIRPLVVNDFFIFALIPALILLQLLGSILAFGRMGRKEGVILILGYVIFLALMF